PQHGGNFRGEGRVSKGNGKLHAGCTIAADRHAPQRNPAEEEAVRVAGRYRWKVFPCWGTRNGKCLCGNPKCDKAGKHPRIANNLEEASCDITKIRSWGKKFPDANWAVPAGKSGLVNLDVDAQNGGIKTLKTLIAAHGKLPPTPRQ